MAKHLIPITVFFGLVLSASAGAQQVPGTVDDGPATEEVEETRYYSVEVIVFEYSDQAAGTDEIFDPELFDTDAPQAGLDGFSDVPVYSDATMAAQPQAGNDSGLSHDGPPAGRDDDNAAGQFPNGEQAEIEAIPTLPDIGFRLLEPEEMTMATIHQKLLRLDAYRPLLWGGWIQAAVDEETSLPVRLRLLGATPLNLSGNLTLYLKNYLHLVVDLLLEQRLASVEPVYRQQESEGGSRPRQKTFGDKYEYAVRDWQVVHFEIQEDRIFNSGHLRYFDHPKFGALVRVNRVEAPGEYAPDFDDRDGGTPMLDAGQVRRAEPGRNPTATEQ